MRNRMCNGSQPLESPLLTVRACVIVTWRANVVASGVALPKEGCRRYAKKTSLDRELFVPASEGEGARTHTAAPVLLLRGACAEPAECRQGRPNGFSAPAAAVLRPRRCAFVRSNFTLEGARPKDCEPFGNYGPGRRLQQPAASPSRAVMRTRASLL